MAKQTFFNQAEERIRRADARATAGRIRVLAFLLTQQSAASHHQIEIALDQDEKIDRVTLYRTLDWLVEHDFAHRVVSADRVWRFRANESHTGHHQHAHFKCDRCAKVICLDELQSAANTPALPDGYRGMEIELTVKGLCAHCA